MAVVIETMSSLSARAEHGMRRALASLASTQEVRGSWAGDYSGPMFLLPMYVILAYASGRHPAEERRRAMVRELSRGRGENGAVGLHAEDHRGSLFTTVLAYVALRMLGIAASDSGMQRMRGWILDQGSPLGAAPWGKLVLCLVGLYEWSGLHPVLPEVWLLPASAPIHPSRLWCHCRQVYLPMAWLYGQKARVREDDLIAELREELYPAPYHEIDWPRQRDRMSPVDVYRAPTVLLKAVNEIASRLERSMPPDFRKRAVDEVFKQLRYEDEVTGFVDIGPVNKVLNAFVHFFRDRAGVDFERAFVACEAYLWEAHDGSLRVQGYNNSELWDTAFAVQAILATPFAQSHLSMLERAYQYIRDNQILDDVPDATRHYRHRSRGGWPFSNRIHGWPTTDCTSEGLKCALALRGRFDPAIPTSLIEDSVQLLLSWQNDDGGFSTYERKRGGSWLERLNPAHVFGDIMVDYSYVECTSACLQALQAARSSLHARWSARIVRAVRRAARFLLRNQLADGSFEGSWGVCFTYGTWFGVSGLLAAGISPRDGAVRKACSFLRGKQRKDGGWGEHGDSCRDRRYIDAPDALVAQTSWALSTLVRAKDDDKDAQARAVENLLGRQLHDGSWAREPMVGVFNRTCLINYDNYRRYFPLWAIAEWHGASTPPPSASAIF